MFMQINSKAKLYLLRLFAMTLISTLALGPVFADVSSSSERGKRSMTKYMVNLAKFIKWPQESFKDAASPYNYCIVGNDVFGDSLDSAMDGKVTKDRGFAIIRLETASETELKDCHVVFLNADEETTYALVDILRTYPILTVGEKEKFAQYGGMIGFYNESRTHVALAVNKTRLEAAKLKASSKLYRVGSR